VKSKADEFRKLMTESLNTYNSVGNTIREMHRNIRCVKGMMCRNGVGDKLIRAGVFCIAGIPEPFISDVMGAMLIAVGAYVRRREGDLRELPKALSKHVIELRKIREILHETKITI
jgi:hypothetical protein